MCFHLAQSPLASQKIATHRYPLFLKKMECWIAGLLDCWLWERFKLVESKTGPDFLQVFFFAGLNHMYGGSFVMNSRVSGIDGGISGQGHVVESSAGVGGNKWAATGTHGFHGWARVKRWYIEEQTTCV